MNQTLYLTADERALFDQLPQTLREGWNVSLEMVTTGEDLAELRMRLHLAHFTDPACARFREAALQSRSVEELTALIKTIDVSSFLPEQLAELFFVLGIENTSQMLRYTLERSVTDEDLEGVAVFSLIRRFLQEANQSVPPVRS